MPGGGRNPNRTPRDPDNKTQRPGARGWGVPGRDLNAGEDDFDGEITFGEDSYLGVGVGNSKFASKVQGRLARARFDDWMDRFASKERELADRATSGEHLQQGLASADEAVQGHFDSAAGQTQRRLGRYGVSQTGAQRAQNERASGLAEVTTNVNARNRTRRAERDRRLSLMSGGGLAGTGDRTGEPGE